MKYEVFQQRIGDIIRRSGDDISVSFSNEAECGRYYACCSDGTTIIGRPNSLKITVKWGSGHEAMAMI